MNTALFLYALTFGVAVLMSERIQRSMLSAAVLFLAAGMASSVVSPAPLESDAPLLVILAEVTLFSVLFTDGLKLQGRDLMRAARLPGRALVFGMPLTIAGTAALAHWISALPWTESILVGAILSPTDPVLVSAIIGRHGIPQRLRRLLHIESGLNDGLALPIVVVVLSTLAGTKSGIVSLLLEVAAGVGLGIAVPWALRAIESSRWFATSERFTPMLPVAAALLVFSIARLTHANEFLGAFTAGVTTATLMPDAGAEFGSFGEHMTTLLKLAALFVFGGLLAPAFFQRLDWREYVFAIAALVAVRPAALGIALARSRLSRREFWAAAWFGPKGFASVTYALMVLQSGIERSQQIFHLCALAIAVSIVMHSSTDVPAAKRLSTPEGPGNRKAA